MNVNKEPSKRQIQISLEILGIAQDFFQRESSGASLITVTRCETSPDMKYATLFITAIPEEKEPAALDFAKRMRTELRHTVMKRLPIKVIPFFEIEIDYGEKNRIHVEELLRKDKLANQAYQDMLKQKESEMNDN